MVFERCDIQARSILLRGFFDLYEWRRRQGYEVCSLCYPSGLRVIMPRLCDSAFAELAGSLLRCAQLTAPAALAEAAACGKSGQPNVCGKLAAARRGCGISTL